jgi:hypothetical protein
MMRAFGFMKNPRIEAADMIAEQQIPWLIKSTFRAL